MNDLQGLEDIIYIYSYPNTKRGLEFERNILNMQRKHPHYKEQVHARRVWGLFDIQIQDFQTIIDFHKTKQAEWLRRIKRHWVQYREFH